MKIPDRLPAKIAAPREVIPGRVLVVDDETLIRWAVCTALAIAGFDAIGAGTAEEARRVAAEWPPPKVILLEIRPDGGGYELIEEMRRICPDSRFLVMSTVRRSGATWPQAPGVESVEKPFDLAVLVRLVEHAAQQATSGPGEPLAPRRELT